MVTCEQKRNRIWNGFKVDFQTPAGKKCYLTFSGKSGFDMFYNDKLFATNLKISNLGIGQIVSNRMKGSKYDFEQDINQMNCLVIDEPTDGKGRIIIRVIEKDMQPIIDAFVKMDELGIQFLREGFAEATKLQEDVEELYRLAGIGAIPINNIKKAFEGNATQVSQIIREGRNEEKACEL